MSSTESFRPSSLSIPPGVAHVGSRVSRARSLFSQEWANVFRAAHLGPDLLAGLAVGASAIPISLAVALASDVPPGVGLATAVVSAAVAALFGGSRVTVTGPAVMLAVLVGQIVDRHGVAALPVVVGLAAACQIALGALGLSAIARVVPPSVLRGFRAGIGITLVLSQLPRVFGLPATDESHTLDVVLRFSTYVSSAQPLAIVLAAIGAALVWLGPTRMPRIPWAVVAMLVPTLLVIAIGETGSAGPALGAVDPPFSRWTMPAWPRDGTHLVFDALAVCLVASLESLANAASVDRERAVVGASDPDQELIGQGLGNLAAALVGGVPATGVPHRTEVAVALGARTRRAALVGALVALAIAWLGASVLAMLPVAAIAGIGIGLAIRTIDVVTLVRAARSNRGEARAIVTTVVLMVAFDVGLGVQAGIVVALAAALYRVTRVRAELEIGHDGVPHSATLSGSLTFLATAQIEALGRRIARLPTTHGLVIDLRRVDAADPTSIDALASLVARAQGRGMKVAILGASAELDARIRDLAPAIASLLTAREADLDRILDRSRLAHGRRQLVQGVQRFRAEQRKALSPLLAELAAGQAPHTFMLTCADSRVVPSLLAGTQPGELFVVRNIGALLPPYGHQTLNDEGAALEYALEVLGVRNVVVCCHAKCGAISALKKGGIPDELGALRHWAKGARELVGDPTAYPSVDDMVRATGVRQLDHLKTYPVVKKALERGELTLATWYYDVERAEVLEWSAEHERYVVIGETAARLSRIPAPPRVEDDSDAHESEVAS